jgi:hypothetical protein
MKDYAAKNIPPFYMRVLGLLKNAFVFIFIDMNIYSVSVIE